MTVLHPRMGKDLVRDPIYNYIWFTIPLTQGEPTERDLIESRWVQRLRRIHQLQSAWLVYPSAVHTRFAHSLGTMHLAGELVERLFAPLSDAVADMPDMNWLIETARLYGLLHDIGHGPFGHLLDDVRPKLYRITHEDISEAIIKEELSEQISTLRRGPQGDFGQEIDLDLLCDLICGKEPRLKAPWWQRVLWQALCGLYSPDKIDYIARDAHFCGTPEYGTVDRDRLLLHSFVDVTEVGALALHTSGEPALVDFLAARLAMYENVYFHRTARAADASFRELLPRTLELMGRDNDPRTDLDSYFELDECLLFARVANWAKKEQGEKRTLGAQWMRLLAHDIPRKEAFAWCLSFRDLSPLVSLILKDPCRLKQSVRENIVEELPSKHKDAAFVVDLAMLDVRPLALLAEKGHVAIFTPRPGQPGEGDFDTRGVGTVLAGLPVKYVACRIFCTAELRDPVRAAAQTALGDHDLQLQDTIY